MAAITRTKVQFGAHLRAMRQAAGVSAEDAARALKVSASQLNKYEAGAARMSWGDVQVVMSVYGATPSSPEWAEASRMHDSVKAERPPIKLPADTPRSIRKLYLHEREALRNRTLARNSLPGLLQTEDYTRLLVEAARHFADPTPARIARIQAIRRDRQQRLTDAKPLILHAVIDESAITRPTGPADVMINQMNHLLEAAKWPNVTIQIIKKDAGMYGNSSGTVEIIDYDLNPDPKSGAQSNVSVEHEAGAEWIVDSDGVNRFSAMFRDVTKMALSPTATSRFIKDQIGTLK
jgi:transcriptional regulator with XRE-family HTH domain